MTIGLVLDTTVRPCRDIALEIARCSHEHGDIGVRIFYGSPATTVRNLAEFATSGLDGMVVCGFRRELVRQFLKAVPERPPVVLGTYAPMSAGSRRLLGCGGTVMLDNEQIGCLAANFFHGHGLRNFAFVGSNIYREAVSSEIRCAAFEKRLREVCGESVWFDRFAVGCVKSNDDCWDSDRAEVLRWLDGLPKPCGVFVNGELEAFKFLGLCQMRGIDVPDQVEILGVDCELGFLELAEPKISGIGINYETGAREVVKMLLSLIENTKLPKTLCDVKVGTSKLKERGTTSHGRGYGLIVERAMEYIHQNACAGIDVEDVVNYLGISRRLLEMRIRESLGKSVLELIHDEKLKEVCRLLTTTDLAISDVTEQAGYPLTSNLGVRFRKAFGRSMRQYRKAFFTVAP